MLAAACIAAPLAAPVAAEDEPASPPRIYRWVDRNGVAHYTTDPDRIPSELRGLLSEPRELTREPVSAQAPAGVDAWIIHDRVPEAPAPAPAEPSQGAAGAAPAVNRLAALDARIAQLEAAISADEDLLKGQLVDPSAPDSNETLRQVADRMPARIEELEKLRAERDALAPASE